MWVIKKGSLAAQTGDQIFAYGYYLQRKLEEITTIEERKDLEMKEVNRRMKEVDYELYSLDSKIKSNKIHLRLKEKEISDLNESGSIGIDDYEKKSFETMQENRRLEANILNLAACERPLLKEKLTLLESGKIISNLKVLMKSLSSKLELLLQEETSYRWNNVLGYSKLLLKNLSILQNYKHEKVNAHRISQRFGDFNIFVLDKLLEINQKSPDEMIIPANLSLSLQPIPNEEDLKSKIE